MEIDPLTVTDTRQSLGPSRDPKRRRHMQRGTKTWRDDTEGAKGEQEGSDLGGGSQRPPPEICRSWEANQRGEVRDPERGSGARGPERERGTETGLLFFENLPV